MAVLRRPTRPTVFIGTAAVLLTRQIPPFKMLREVLASCELVVAFPMESCRVDHS